MDSFSELARGATFSFRCRILELEGTYLKQTALQMAKELAELAECAEQSQFERYARLCRRLSMYLELVAGGLLDIRTTQYKMLSDVFILMGKLSEELSLNPESNCGEYYERAREIVLEAEPSLRNLFPVNSIFPKN